MSKVKSGFLALILLVFVGASFLAPVADNVFAAPPTPVVADGAARDAVVIKLFNTEGVTADTRRCTQVPVGNYSKMDLAWYIDQTVVNTTTLKLQFTNDQVHYYDGLTIVSANAADAGALQEYNTFGWWACVYADVTNSSSVSIYAQATFK